MRGGDPQRLRGESARVAARVQALLREYHLDGARSVPPPPQPEVGVGWPRPAPDRDLDPTPEPLAPAHWREPGEDPAAPVAPVAPSLRTPVAEPLPRRVPPSSGLPPWLEEPADWIPPERGSPDAHSWPWEPRVRGRPTLPSPDGRADAPRRPGLASGVLAPPDGDEVELDDSGPDTSPSAMPRAARDGGPRWWQRLIGRVPVRVDPGRRTAIGVGLAVVVVAAVTGVWLVSTRPESLPVTAVSTPGTQPPTTSSSPTVAASPALVVVDVAGKVRRPGIYRLPTGSRVDDAIRAAGGARPGVDLTGLNLAARLVDGQQIAVGRPGAGGVSGVTGGGGAGGGSATGTAAPVDLNTASLEQLQTLPGVGPVLGQHILDFRTQHGGFASVDQLRRVSGIGDVRFAQLKPLVTV